MQSNFISRTQTGSAGPLPPGWITSLLVSLQHELSRKLDVHSTDVLLDQLQTVLVTKTFLNSERNQHLLKLTSTNESCTKKILFIRKTQIQWILNLNLSWLKIWVFMAPAKRLQVQSGTCVEHQLKGNLKAAVKPNQHWDEKNHSKVSVNKRNRIPWRNAYHPPPFMPEL